MENFEVIKNQIIAGTGLDNHGESYSKEFFEELLELTPNRMPLHTQHVMGAKTGGFLENFRLVPHGDEWVVIGLCCVIRSENQTACNWLILIQYTEFQAYQAL
ncbi:hypothetical protein J7G27_004279 [Vibrio vulnificus]|nr:hypothetical protein [Vibrio vulnificus]